MPEPAPSYSFHPLERRGVILGIRAGQLAAAAISLIVGLLLHGVVPGAAGSYAAVCTAATGVLCALWSRSGTSVASWAVVATAWLSRRRVQPRLEGSPLVGEPFSSSAAGSIHPPRVGGHGLAPLGVSVIERHWSSGDGRVGVVHDRRFATLIAVVPVSGCSFSLLDPFEQGRRLDSWRTVLGALSRPGGTVLRLQWLQQTSTAPPRLRRALHSSGGDPSVGTIPGAHRETDGLAGYGELVADTVPSIVTHDAWVAVVVAARRRTPHTRAADEALQRETRLLRGQLAAADLEPGSPLDAHELTELMTAGLGRWPLATREHWSSFQTDGTWHATYWVAEWPRVDVGPDFLGPLLLGSGSRITSVVMAAVGADRALRDVRSARTADVADAQLRDRAGFLSSARRQKEVEGVARREAELAEGHNEFRFSGYVTVTASDPDGLSAACAETEQAAQAARVELRRMYGRQADAYTWTMPLGRGLR